MCPICGQAFGRRKRCYSCQPGRTKTGEYRNCQVCGKQIYAEVNESDKRFCSRACLHESMRLKGPGARIKRVDGYVMVYYPTHPDAGARRFVLEHRLVMEKVLGRRLRKDEQVNHINHIRDDNRPENLEAVSSKEHAKDTAAWAKERRRKDREELNALRLELATYRERYGPL